MGTEHDGQGRKFVGIYIGVVTHNNDPWKVGRVRTRVPGVVEPASAWALPLGSPAGGAKRRGAFAPPDVGAEVAVFFAGGDLDHPHYFCGYWGAPDTGLETPGPVGGYFSVEAGDVEEEISPEDAPKVKAFEGERFIVILDERSGRERMVFRDKKSDDQIYFDGVKYALQIKASSLLHLKSDGVVKIDGAQVNINGRVVASNKRPIR